MRPAFLLAFSLARADLGMIRKSMALAPISAPETAKRFAGCSRSRASWNDRRARSQATRRKHGSPSEKDA
ncbi:hypothetical protein D1O30_07000 [Methylocystis hirsuta]|uniref:Uncharacterized protein n=1 Tax=Methylocystis hirsuta TaxID=369798 RepID=A0A3M9XP00_9HYPH|nr:hypothetical protein D1O30_07000 [Methylocystis hirsuta]